ncbi:hypothetical protein AeNC1_015752, partial [Aphanomyces euteiches]
MAKFRSELTLDREAINSVFQVDGKQRCPSELMDHIHNVVYCSILTSTTAASFHAFWDAIILGTLDYFYASRGYSWDRPWHKGSSRNSYRPDFIFRLVDMCVLRGEERAPNVDLEVPRRQLLEHFEWSYDPAPYVFAYVACGYELKLYAVIPHGADVAEDCRRCHKKRKLPACKMIYLDYFNLESLSGRLNLFRSLVNIAPYLWRIVKICPIRARCDFACFDDNFVLKDVYEGAPVVLKSFRSDVAAQRIGHLKVVYDVMKNANVPNVDKLVHCGKYYARLSPVGAGGFPFCRFPTNEQTVLEAIQSILEALVVLHSVGWMHRDIRWSNVIKPANQSKWFLIDFDHAATSPQDNSKDERLTSEEHAPDMF